jgi:RNase H-fold protein (predicted Holliday junction resolvase)
MTELFGYRSLRVLAVDPATRGFGYALFEGPRRLVAWGTKDIRTERDRVALQKVKELIKRYKPAVLVVEDCGHPRSRRNRRVRRLTEKMLALARKSGSKGHALPLVAVYEQFSRRSVQRKYEIACTLARKFPALTLRLPPKKKPWEGEDHRMSIFDAASFGYTYLATRRPRPAPRSPNAAP